MLMVSGCAVSVGDSSGHSGDIGAVSARSADTDSQVSQAGQVGSDSSDNSGSTAGVGVAVGSGESGSSSAEENPAGGTEDGGAVDFDGAYYAPSEEDMAALELIGCYCDEAGRYMINTDDWVKSDDLGLLRQYFFGTWGEPDADTTKFVIGESEDALMMKDRNFRFNGFYSIGGTVLVYVINGNAECIAFWLDVNAPDTMYIEPYNDGWLFNFGGKEHELAVCTRISGSTGQTAEQLSIYSLLELSQKYGIDSSLLTDIEYTVDGGEYSLYHDDWYQFYPVYLVSEEPERLVLRTSVGNALASDQVLGAEMIIEKINGEWKRRIDFFGQ